VRRAKPRNARRCAAVAAALLWAGGVVGVPPAHAQESVDLAKAAKVKAAYLLNFIRYTKWPDGAFETLDSPIVLTMVGACDAADVLGEVVRRAPPVDGHRVVLSRATLPSGRADAPQADSFVETARRSHLLYVCSADAGRLGPILERLKDAHVLTVGDVPGFARNGGMLGFVLREDRIVFEANLKALQDTPLSVSAKVLKLAQIVDGVER
jgi:hypothetical protein